MSSISIARKKKAVIEHMLFFALRVLGMMFVYTAVTWNDRTYDKTHFARIVIAYTGVLIFAVAVGKQNKLDAQNEKGFPAPVCYEVMGAWEIDRHDSIIRMTPEEFEQFCSLEE